MDKADKASLENYIVLMYDLMHKMRSDLALLQGEDANKPILDSAADQLLEIANNSINSSENILKANDNIATISESFLKQNKYPTVRKQFESILGSCVNVRVASTHQEASLKRITNVIQTINQVEGILNSLVVKIGDGQITGIDSALSGISVKKTNDTSEKIQMSSHKRPKASAARLTKPK